MFPLLLYRDVAGCKLAQRDTAKKPARDVRVGGPVVNPGVRLLLILPHRTKPPTCYAHDDGDAREVATEHSLLFTLKGSRLNVNERKNWALVKFHMLAIYYTYYNFCRIHQTLRVTPAMEAGLAHHVWSIEELVGLLEPKSILDGLYRRVA